VLFRSHISMDRNTLFRHGGAVIGSVDQGTSSTRYIVFNGKGELVASAQMEHTQIYPSGEGKVCPLLIDSSSLCFLHSFDFSHGSPSFLLYTTFTTVGGVART